MLCGLPRLIVAGAGGDSGKTLVSLGLIRAWRDAGLTVAAFKKGPDYIDAAWLSAAAGGPARNLDEWLMGVDGVRESFRHHAQGADLCVLEGNRGLLDGFEGTSTARLADLLGAPVILVLDVRKVTRTAAALVKGLQVLAPKVTFGGVVLNRVGGKRHEMEVRRAIEESTGVPVVGVVPKLRDRSLLPYRHLGLVPPEEHQHWERVSEHLAAVIREHVRLDAVLGEAWRRAPETVSGCVHPESREAGPARGRSATSAAATGSAEVTHGESPVGEALIRVGLFRDAAFSFYYPENLEALASAGAELVEISPLQDRDLPDCDLLYLGGGFPETHAGRLSTNLKMRQAVARAVDGGLPVYAECGGLIYLARSVTFQGKRHELCGVLDVDIVVDDCLQGHGYAEMVVDRENPFFPVGSILRGHEHHHSRLQASPRACATAMTVRRGKGSDAGRDGLVTGNVLATWLHIHAVGMPEWAPALVRSARLMAASRDDRRVAVSKTQANRSQ